MNGRRGEGDQGPDRRRDPACLAAVWIGALIFFWPILFGGRTLYFRDTLSHYYPQAWLTAEAWRHGHPPFWEPLLGLGYPAHADPHFMSFYPLAAVLLLLPFPLAYNVLVVLHVPLGGSFMYLLQRAWRLSPAASLTGATLFMFSGYAVSTVALTTLLKGLTWAPLAMLCMERFLAGGRPGWVAATAGVLAVQGSGTDPQYVLFTLGLLACAPWFRPRASPRPALQIGAAWAGAAALAGALLAFQYLPLAELIGQSDRVGGLGAMELGFFPVRPIWLLSMLIPPSFPDPAHPYFLLSFPDSYQPFYPDLYVGPALLALAVSSAGLAGLRSRDEAGGRTAVAAMIVTVLGLVMALGEAGRLFAWVQALIPPLRAFRFASKYFLFVGFALPVLAGLGFEGLASGRSSVRRLFVGALTAIALVQGSLWMWVAARGPELALDFLGARQTAGDGAGAGGVPEIQAVTGGWSAGLSGGLVLTLGLGFTALLHARGALRRPLFLAAIGLLAAGDLCFNTHRGLLHAPADILARPPAAAGMLVADGPVPARYATYSRARIVYRPGRLALDTYREARDLMRFLLGACYGQNPLLASLSVRLAWEPVVSDILAAAPPPVAAQLVARMGCGHFLGLDHPLLGTEVGRAGNVVVERIPGVSPRAFVPRRAMASAAASPPTTAALLALAEEAIYEVPAGVALPPPLAPRTVRRCALVLRAHDRLEVDVDVDGPALVVVLEADYPGWKASVDGEERPIRRVAGMFRGVVVRPGDRRLTMRYTPAAFRTGMGITLFALLGLAGTLLAGLLRKRQAASTPGA